MEQAQYTDRARIAEPQPTPDDPKVFTWYNHGTCPAQAVSGPGGHPEFCASCGVEILYHPGDEW